MPFSFAISQRLGNLSGSVTSDDNCSLVRNLGSLLVVDALTKQLLVESAFERAMGVSGCIVFSNVFLAGSNHQEEVAN